MARLKDISIAKKLYFIVGAMAILITTELLVLWFSIHTLSSVRAFIGAEGLWSKAQKDAVDQLGKYHRTHNEQDFGEFKKLLAVPLGDHKARIELFKKDPDLDIVRRGLSEGRVHRDDIDGMIKLVTRFNRNYYIKNAIGYWAKGDSLIAILIPTAEAMQREINSGSASPEKLEQLNLEIGSINEQLTKLEDSFSFTLEEGARWLENLILKILFSVALTVEITGLVLTVLVTRNITRGLNAINKATNQITKGHFKERAIVFSNDEIGHVATSVNKMAEQLIDSNQELENFAYVAAHDLQEPLRKIMMFTDILQHEPGNGFSEKGRDYMEKIVESAARMQKLVEDLLQFGAVDSITGFETVDLDKILSQVLSDMEITVSQTHARITISSLPAIEANMTQMQQLFQNLLSNALKFSGENAVITISGEMTGDIPATTAKKPNGIPPKFCKISVKDNGIGFEEIYLDKIFSPFQRLHGKKEYEGTGIGLAICRKIVEKHHGVITAESIPGKGATFIIVLPLSQKEFKNTTEPGSENSL